MTRRTRTWLGVISLVVVVGTAILAAVRVEVLTGGSLLRPPVASVSVSLPGRGGQMDLDIPSVSWLAPYQARHITVQRAGQDVIDTDLFPTALTPEHGLALYWIAAEGREGPYVRLADPAGDILLDLRGFRAWRVTTNGDQPWLAAPTGVSVAGHVAEGDGTMTMVAGRPFVGLAAERTGELLGLIEAGEAGAVWRPADGGDE
ncbi:hypothetical protein [Rhodospira trueperi]|uniref:Uncharacterized protein n=1 Tax=Rhodospira trueperi TaxID=69960 RepID=A0A1G7EHY4_9PROT|nr:hypothetical protein [Rhodospira trueperi]SDE63310.1 hypothetical protein SAMN05421720_10979 [Rhodospira trueperi]